MLSTQTALTDWQNIIRMSLPLNQNVRTKATTKVTPSHLKIFFKRKDKCADSIKMKGESGAVLWFIMPPGRKGLAFSGESWSHRVHVMTMKPGGWKPRWILYVYHLSLCLSVSVSLFLSLSLSLCLSLSLALSLMLRQWSPEDENLDGSRTFIISLSLSLCLYMMMHEPQETPPYVNTACLFLLHLS